MPKRTQSPRHRYTRNYHHNIIEGLAKDKEYLESQKEAWQAVSDSLPDGAFADNVNVREDYGTVRRPATHVFTAFQL